MIPAAAARTFTPRDALVALSVSCAWLSSGPPVSAAAGAAPASRSALLLLPAAPTGGSTPDTAPAICAASICATAGVGTGAALPIRSPTSPDTPGQVAIPAPAVLVLPPEGSHSPGRWRLGPAETASKRPAPGGSLLSLALRPGAGGRNGEERGSQLVWLALRRCCRASVCRLPWADLGVPPSAVGTSTAPGLRMGLWCRCCKEITVAEVVLRCPRWCNSQYPLIPVRMGSPARSLDVGHRAEVHRSNILLAACLQ